MHRECKCIINHLPLHQCMYPLMGTSWPRGLHWRMQILQNSQLQQWNKKRVNLFDGCAAEIVFIKPIHSIYNAPKPRFQQCTCGIFERLLHRVQPLNVQWRQTFLCGPSTKSLWGGYSGSFNTYLKSLQVGIHQSAAVTDGYLVAFEDQCCSYTLSSSTNIPLTVFLTQVCYEANKRICWILGQTELYSHTNALFSAICPKS